MGKSFPYRYFYVAAAIFFIAYLVITIMQMHHVGGWILMLSFLSVAIAFRGSKLLKGLSYTLVILAVVSLSMYYPQHFQTVGDFKLSGLIVPLLQVIMFGMGTELSIKDFNNVLRMPKGIIVGIVCHYTIMPLIGLFYVAPSFARAPYLPARQACTFRSTYQT